MSGDQTDDAREDLLAVAHRLRCLREGGAVVSPALREGLLTVYERRDALRPSSSGPRTGRIDVHKRFHDGPDPDTQAQFTFGRSYGQVIAGAHGGDQRQRTGLNEAMRSVGHWSNLYAEAIPAADQLFDDHLQTIANEGPTDGSE